MLTPLHSKHAEEKHIKTSIATIKGFEYFGDTTRSMLARRVLCLQFLLITELVY
ncbi:hypothetical protein U1Q18_018934 [Sarracenia purpurea var. burkii]